MNSLSPHSNKTLKESLLKRIETEDVCPRSRWFFMVQECFIWTFWLLSVVVGAFAVAVSLFVAVHHQYALYEATHENLFTFMVEVLPYLWLAVFGSTVYLAVYNLRHTRRGYKYSLTTILLSSLILSFAGGSALQYFGLGYTIDNILGQQMQIYVSQEKLEERLWQVPDEGRLVGKMILSTSAPTTTIIFHDIDDNRWNMNISELSERDIKLLRLDRTVRLLGEVKNGQLNIFHACGVFPWMHDNEMTMEEMSLERKAFVEQVYNHMKKAEDRLELIENEAYSSTTLPLQSVCANIAMVRRMPHK